MELFNIAEDKERLKLVVGVSSGIYMAARSPELGSIVRKLGFALTRGANAIELAEDVPHEIDFTQGKELRYIAEKQGLTLLLHGSLTVPMAMPERVEWRDAQNHIQKSIRSAVMGGCKYVNFHACLNFWLEMMTYAGRKLTMIFCDHEGNFIDNILAGDKGKKLREWFTEKKWPDYYRSVLTTEELSEVSREATDKSDKYRNNETVKRLREAGIVDERITNWVLTHRTVPPGVDTAQADKIGTIITDVTKDVRERVGKIERNSVIKVMQEKLERKGKWDSEEIRGMVSVIDGYHIIGHYLFYTKDPIWLEMVKVYQNVIDRYKTVTFRDPVANEVKEYPYPDGKYWLDGAWEKAESENDREFKEFYYSVCAAKYIEGHISVTLKWMSDESPNGLIGSIRAEATDEKDFEKLKGIAKELRIALEIPDSRSPEYAGLYLICRPKQIYAAVKTIREQLKTDKLTMLIDFEHITTQGFDALNEIKEFVKLAPDAGKYILSLHVTKPTPLHHHIQVEIGDIDVYKLLWELTKAGLGKYHTTYLIFERGGERDPFKQSVTAIRLMVDQLQQGTKPEELVAKPEFFGVTGPTLGSEERQRVVIQEHARDPIEGLLVVPEETHTALGKAGIGKVGKEKWKKEELA